MSRFTLIFLFLSVCFSLNAQKYYFDHFGIKQNLSNSDVYVISQSTDGNVWIGTKSGISSFDGLKFNNFFSENGTAENGMKAIYQDTVGGVWFGHVGGGLTYYIDGKFYDRSIDRVSADITSIGGDSEGRLWISTYNDGVFRINNLYDNPSLFKVDHFAGAEGLSDRVSNICYTKTYGLLFITDYGVKYWDKEKNSFGYIKNLIKGWPEYFPVITVIEDNDESLWVGTYNGGLYHFMNNGQKVQVYDHRDGLAKNWISYLYQDRKNTIWVGTWGGGITTISDGKLKTFNNENGLAASKIRCVFEDYEGNILIGSRNNGIFVYKGGAFEHFTEFPSEHAVHVTSICENKNECWFGSESGLWIFNDNGSKPEYKHISASTERNLKSDNIRFLINDKQKDIWIGTWGGGVSTYNKKNRRFEYNFLVNRYVMDASNGNVSAMTIDHDNNLFIGASEGLIYYEIDNRKIDFLTQTNGLAGNDITALFTSSDGTVWIGSRGKGLSTIKGANIKTVPLDISFTATCFAETKDSAIWVGTEGRGVIIIKDGKLQKTLSDKSGISSGLISALIADSNNVFIGTPKGLFEYSDKLKRVIYYGEKEGFSGVEVRSNAVYKNRNGEIYFGTSDGATRMNLSKLRFNKYPPKITISQVQVDLENQSLNKVAVLGYTYNSLIINYKAICISDAEKVRYKVMLEGADKSWQPITKQSFASYPSLSPGEYTFKVLAMNNSGVWNTKPASFSFVIKPPFWKTLWFYGIVAASLGVLMIVFIKVRERKLKTEKAILESRVAMRTTQIWEKNNLLAKKNKDITDSINYARRIQSALMPSKEKISAELEHSFVFYRPKDIVSGDFYWFAKENNQILIAAADCTGHGVPGAFMSMISISSLNKIVKENHITKPGQVLNQLRKDVIDNMAQGTGGQWDSKDGLDIALLNINKEKQQVEYAGAYNSLYIIKEKEFDENDILYDFKYSVYKNRLIEVKAERMPIGISERMNKEFITKTIKIEKGDLLIISTDGYIDQFGGENGKKLMSRKFKDILLELNGKNQVEMQKLLKIRFNQWIGDYEQIDDVLVIGIGF